MKDDPLIEIVDRLARIETKLDNHEQLRESRYSTLNGKNNEGDIAEIKENQKWTWRTIAGIGVSVAVYLITKYLGGI